MTNAQVKSNIWRNATSNYLCLGLRLVTGLVMFRMLYQNLSKEEFGFWGLLWSVFGYGVLLDFGFGFTAQKRVAELSVHQEWSRLSQVLSTIFFSYVAVAVAIMAIGYFGAPYVIDLLRISPGNRERFQTVLTWFICGLGMAFPLGLFPEMLRGQQRIALANVIFSGGMIAQFILVALAVHYEWGLKALVAIALVCTFIPDLTAGFFALHRLKAVQIRPSLFSRGMVRDTMSFSLFAYVTTVSNVLLGKTDQVVISSAIAVSAVALYQAAAKVSEMFAAISQQLPDVLSPAAAHLHARGDREVLRELLINGSRFTVMLSTPIYLVCALHMRTLLRLLTGESVPITFWLGEVLLLWSYTTVVTQSVSKRIYMMCGHEKFLTVLGSGEALLNLALSIGLVLRYHSLLGVAIGSLVSTFLFGWGFLWPWAARQAQLSPWKLARDVLGPTWLACFPLLLLVGLEQFVSIEDLRTSPYSFMMISGGALALTATCVWRIALTKLERSHFSAVVTRLLGRQKPA